MSISKMDESAGMVRSRLSGVKCCTKNRLVRTNKQGVETPPLAIEGIEIRPLLNNAVEVAEFKVKNEF